jgi:hypothetical protein
MVPVKGHFIGITFFVAALIISYNLIWYFDICSLPSVRCN